MEHCTRCAGRNREETKTHSFFPDRGCLLTFSEDGLDGRGKEGGYQEKHANNTLISTKRREIELTVRGGPAAILSG